MTASKEYTRLMHCLINIQRGSKITTKDILFKSQLITDPQQVAHILADYYDDLTTPKNLEKCDDYHLSAIEAL